MRQQRALLTLSPHYNPVMAEILDTNLISRLIDEELASAKATCGPRHFDIIVLENSRGDTISDRNLLDALRHLNKTGSRYTAALKEVTPRGVAAVWLAHE